MLQLQTQILELQSQFDVKDRELGQVQHQYDTLKSQLEETHAVRAAAVAQLLICSSQDHRVEARDREQGTGLSQIGSVLAKVTSAVDMLCCAALQPRIESANILLLIYCWLSTPYRSCVTGWKSFAQPLITLLLLSL